MFIFAMTIALKILIYIIKDFNFNNKIIFEKFNKKFRNIIKTKN